MLCQKASGVSWTLENGCLLVSLPCLTLASNQRHGFNGTPILRTGDSNRRPEGLQTLQPVKPNYFSGSGGGESILKALGRRFV